MAEHYYKIIETIMYDGGNEYFKFLNNNNSAPYLKGFEYVTSLFALFKKNCHRHPMIPLYLNNVGTIFPTECQYHGLNSILCTDSGLRFNVMSKCISGSSSGSNCVKGCL